MATSYPLRRICACLLAALLGASVYAQRPDAKVVQIGLTLLRNRAVQKELALDRRQVKLIDAQFQDYVAMAQHMFTANMTAKQRADKIRKLGPIQDAISARVLCVLTAKQTARLREVVLQAEGIGSFRIHEVSRQLGLSGAQQQRIRGYERELGEGVQRLKDRGRKDVQALPAPRDRRDKAQIEAYKKAVVAIVGRTMNAVAALERKALSEAVASLTAKQRATWKQMLGRTFSPK
jgi:hypothetical protein